MSLKALLKTFAGGDAETVQRLEKRVAGCRADIAEAEKVFRKAALEDSRRGGSALPAKRAAEKVALAKARLDMAEAALQEALDRRAKLERAKVAEAEKRRQRAARASLRRLREIGETVDERLDELVEALHIALDEARVLGGLTTDSTTRAQLATAFSAVDYCVRSKLLFLQGKIDSTATPARTKFSNYLPEPSALQTAGEATTASPEAVA